MLFLSILAIVTGAAHSRISPPTWPQGYSYECIIRNKYDFKQIAKYYVSLGSQRIREDIEGDTNTNFYRGSEGWKTIRTSYFPTSNTSSGEYDVTQCTTTDVTAKGLGQSLLPEMTSFYEYVRDEPFRGVTTQRWEQKFPGFHQIVWIRYADGSPIPVSSEIKSYGGNDDSILLTHTYIDYYNYEPKEPDSSVFENHYEVKCAEDQVSESSAATPMIDGKAEIFMRRELFLKRKALVEAHNRGNSSYKLKLNKFAHMTDEEVLKYTSGFNRGMPEYVELFPFETEISLRDEDIPESFDWRIHGAVTPVKNQQHCGSCWAFATAGVLEGAYFLKSQMLEILSEQALIDCTWGVGNDGCNGGLPNNALNWVQQVRGIPTTAEYGQYSAINGRCRFNSTKLVAPVKSFRQVQPTVEAVKAALVHHGPLAVSIDAGDSNHMDFSMYSHGVFKPESWSQNVTHAVLLVGYGSLDGEPYWLVKNSWGLDWGLNGYGLISAENNTINLLSHAWYAEL